MPRLVVLIIPIAVKRKNHFNVAEAFLTGG
jgi:hypothetical protein